MGSEMCIRDRAKRDQSKQRVLRKNLPGETLCDILIMRNWISYAKMIGDLSYKKITKEVPDHTILSVFLRDILNLTGTHIGCDTSQCGACVVHVDGKSIKSCTAFAADLDGSKITTIEGLVKNGKMHPMQVAFKKMHGLQCGFCTPGMVMSAIDLLNNNKN